ncbi:MAG: potassium-transporting ATPase subunit KdpA, partial [Dehalococcoidia bacterium]
MAIDILQMAVVLALLVLLAVPVGRYMAAVFTGGRTWLDPVFDRIDNAIYRLSGIRKEPQRWPAYVRAMLLTNLVMFLMILAILELQHLLPLNPDGMGFVNPLLAFNTAASFITNTNWQNYGGESTLSYFSQMFAIIFPMFTSAATGLACGIAFIRGLGGSVDLGNFYVDLTRSITRILLPAALIIGVVLVGLGVPATFSGAETVNTLNGPLAAAPAPVVGEANDRRWLEALEFVVEHLLKFQEAEQAPEFVNSLVERLRLAGVPVPAPVNTPYLNTLPPTSQPAYPGDRAIERRIKSFIRWNAMAMVVNANRGHGGPGGHISS